MRLGKDGLTHEVVFEQEPSSWKQKQVQRPCGRNFRACSGNIRNRGVGVAVSNGDSGKKCTLRGSHGPPHVDCGKTIYLILCKAEVESQQRDGMAQLLFLKFCFFNIFILKLL